jgi:hypothetical protein
LRTCGVGFNVRLPKVAVATEGWAASATA